MHRKIKVETMSTKPVHPLRLPYDLAHTTAVIDWAENEGFPVTRPTEYQIKIGPWNYYPKRQKFYSDVNPAQTQQDFENFKRAVLRWNANYAIDDSP